MTFKNRREVFLVCYYEKKYEHLQNNYVIVFYTNTNGIDSMQHQRRVVRLSIFGLWPYTTPVIEKQPQNIPPPHNLSKNDIYKQ